MSKKPAFTKGEKLQREGEDGTWRNVTVTEYHPSVGFVSFFYDDNPQTKFVGGDIFFRPRPKGWDYPGGHEQYEMDRTTLERTAMLSEIASFTTDEGIPALVEIGNNCVAVGRALSHLLPYLKGKGVL